MDELSQNLWHAANRAKTIYDAEFSTWIAHLINGDPIDDRTLDRAFSEWKTAVRDTFRRG